MEYISQSKEIINKVRNSLLNKYGVKCGYNKPDVMEKMKSKESQLRRTETLKRNKSYTKSIPEERLNILLVENMEKVMYLDNSYLKNILGIVILYQIYRYIY